LKSKTKGQTHLTLNVGNLLIREAVLVQRDLGDLEEPEEAQLAREEEQKGASRLAGASCSAHAVNVIARIVRGVELDDPVDLGDVETAGGDVGAEKDAGGSVAKLEEGVGSLLLLLLALQRCEWDASRQFGTKNA
jgi:hypothetical protein